MRVSAAALALALFFCLGGSRVARAEPLHLLDDPAFAVSLKSGYIYASDSALTANWYRPMMLEFSWAPLRIDRPWFSRVTFYGVLNLEVADFSYAEQPSTVGGGSGDLTGIHRAGMQVGPYVTMGGGLRLSVLDLRKWHVDVFCEYVGMLVPADIKVKGLTIDINGLQVDVAKSVQKDAGPTFGWRTITAGATVARSFQPARARVRFTPHLTIGVNEYRAAIAFNVKPALNNALMQLKIDPSVMHERAIDRIQPYIMLGLRTDFSRRWSLDIAAMAGKLSDTVIVSVNAGVTFRFGFFKNQ